LGLFGIAALVAPAIGPILGGWLVDLHLWRVIFFVNPPIGVIGVVLGMAFLREGKEGEHPRFDLAGVITEIIGFGAILYAASIAADEGWTSPTTLMFFGIGAVGLILFGIIELFFSKTPLMDLRLFKNRVFLVASLLGYVSTIALFGAEFLMPIYLQALRGLTALQTGLILLPMAIAGGIFVTVSGQLYDRWGPRPLLVSGFALLVINTWQLSQIRADTTIGWIIFLLVLRGLALGLTVQTTIVTSLSVVPMKDLARGSSLTNSSRLVIQSIGVAVLATVLVSGITPQVKNMQDQMQNSLGAASPQTPGLCLAQPSSAAPLAGQNKPVLLSSLPGQIPGPAFPNGAIIQQACEEYTAGFERSYTVTFFAALAAFILGFGVPGWPGKWSGRQAGEHVTVTH
jgi:DHA2 family multidrug resistance protein